MPKLRAWSLVRRVYALVRGVGRKRLAVAVIMVVLQGAAQVVGVSAIFPFLQIASDPAVFRRSIVASWLPIEDWSDRHLLLVAGLACVVAMCVSNLVSLAAIFTRARYAGGVATHLRKTSFRNVLARPYAFFLGDHSSRLIQQIQVEVEQLSSYVLMPLLNLCAAGLTVSLLFATVVVLNPIAAMCAVAAIALFYVTAFVIVRRRAQRCGERMYLFSHSMVQTLQEAVANIKTVKAFDRANSFELKYASASDAKARCQPWMQMYAAAPKFFIEPLGLGGMVLIMMTAIASGGSLSSIMPTLGVLALCAYRLLPEAQKIYAEIASIVSYSYVINSVESHVLLPRDLHSGRGQAIEFRSRIRFEGVAFEYPEASSPVLEGVTLDILSNTSVGISGPSGSGKTTFVDILLGLLEPTQGQVSVDMVPLTANNLSSWRALVAYVPQEVQMFDDTVAANIAFGVEAKDVNHGLLREAAGQAQILDFIEQKLPEGFDTVVGERGARLSGGQRQRIGLARALYRKPKMLVLDEATSALDSATESMVMRALRQLHGQMTIVVIAHRTDTLNTCDVRLQFPLNAATSVSDRADMPAS